MTDTSESSPALRESRTTRGTARVHVWSTPEPRRRLLLGHGAGGGVQAPDLLAVAQALPGTGTEVWLVEQPWRVAGRRVAPAPTTLDEAWVQVLADVPRDLPLLVGGRSAGARVASRTALATGATGVVALAFPLHPPGKPEKSRAAELDGAGVPVLVVQGANDPFGRPGEIAAAPGRAVVSVAGDHSLRSDTAAVVAAVAGFVSRWP
ncbi:MAG: alpha/beta family hydrolase [Jiangellales bacterium]